MQATTDHWCYSQRIIFRFIFILFSLFILLFNNGTYPLMFLLMKYPLHLLHVFIPWVGANILHLPAQITTFTNGSGDTTYDYVVLLLIAVFSFLGTMVWSLLDRKAENYSKLFYWLTVAVRFYVGFMLVNYGAVKVIKLQFPEPGFSRLTQAYGESSPMGLAWTFLGFSKGYNLFMGVAELMAGLLLFRRTVTIGAILTLMAAANVMAVNYFYDVPVKIVSTALVLMSIFLLSPNFTRLIKLFFAGEAVQLKTLQAPLLKEKWLRISKYSLKYLTIAFVLFTVIFSVLRSRKIYGDQAPKFPLYGAYSVNKIIAPDSSVTRKWKVLMLINADYSAIKFVDDGLEYCKVKTDTTKKSISFVYNEDYKNPQVFNYTFSGSDLVLHEKSASGKVVLELTKKKFPLMERGFHWVNDMPFNR
jgi:hypothetical protein